MEKGTSRFLLILETYKKPTRSEAITAILIMTVVSRSVIFQFTLLRHARYRTRKIPRIPTTIANEMTKSKGSGRVR